MEAAARQLVGPQVDSKWGGWKLYLSGVQGDAQPLVSHTESTTIHLNTTTPAVLLSGTHAVEVIDVFYLFNINELTWHLHVCFHTLQETETCRCYFHDKEAMSKSSRCLDWHKLEDMTDNDSNKLKGPCSPSLCVTPFTQLPNQAQNMMACALQMGWLFLWHCAETSCSNFAWLSTSHELIIISYASADFLFQCGWGVSAWGLVDIIPATASRPPNLIYSIWKWPSWAPFKHFKPLQTNMWTRFWRSAQTQRPLHSESTRTSVLQYYLWLLFE